MSPRPLGPTLPPRRRPGRPRGSTFAADVVSSASTSWDAGPAVVTRGRRRRRAPRRHERASRPSVRGHRAPGRLAARLGERLCEAVVPQSAAETPDPNQAEPRRLRVVQGPRENGGDDGLAAGRRTPSSCAASCSASRRAGTTRSPSPRAGARAQGLGAPRGALRLRGDGQGGARTRSSRWTTTASSTSRAMSRENPSPSAAWRDTRARPSSWPRCSPSTSTRLFISAPKVKAHRFGVTSMSIKGGQGVVMFSDASPAFNQKWRMHKELGDALKPLAKERKPDPRPTSPPSTRSPSAWPTSSSSPPDVVLADGAPAMGGDGFGKLAHDERVASAAPTRSSWIASAPVPRLWDNAASRASSAATRRPRSSRWRRSASVSTQRAVVDGEVPIARRVAPVHLLSMSGFSLHSDGTPDAGRTRERTRRRRGMLPVLHAGTSTPPRSRRRLRDARVGARRRRSLRHRLERRPHGGETRSAGLVEGCTLHALGARGRRPLVDERRPRQDRARKALRRGLRRVFSRPTRRAERYPRSRSARSGHFFDLAVDRRRSERHGLVEPAQVATRVDRARHQAPPSRSRSARPTSCGCSGLAGGCRSRFTG